MMLQIDFWQFVGAFATVTVFVLGILVAIGRIVIQQFIDRMDVRFKSLEELQAREAEGWQRLGARFGALEELQQREAAEWQRLEREFMTFKADLPLNYVRREDYVRNQTVIEAKLDAVALKIENLQLRGTQR